MPHCSLEFSRIGLSVAVHSQWNEEQSNCALRIFTGSKHAEDFLATIPRTERNSFRPCATILNTCPDFPIILEIRGDIALSLTSHLTVLAQEIALGTRIFGRLRKPELFGFWEPPATHALGAGIIMWFHPNAGYHVAITHSKEQAEEVIRGLPWLRAQRRQRLLGKINAWHTPQRSDQATQKIKGVIAEVLCKASLAARINIARNAHAAATWN